MGLVGSSYGLKIQSTAGSCPRSLPSSMKSWRWSDWRSTFLWSFTTLWFTRTIFLQEKALKTGKVRFFDIFCMEKFSFHSKFKTYCRWRNSTTTSPQKGRTGFYPRPSFLQREIFNFPLAKISKHFPTSHSQIFITRFPNFYPHQYHLQIMWIEW